MLKTSVKQGKSTQHILIFLGGGSSEEKHEEVKGSGRNKNFGTPNWCLLSLATV